jgi:hypothetical protein
MFSTANTPQNHHPPRGRIAPPQTTASRAGTIYSAAAALPNVAAVTLVPAAFLSFADCRPANK